MGNCFGGGGDDDERGGGEQQQQQQQQHMDPEERRKLQAEAAEKRLKEGEARGLKDPEGVKRRIEAKERAARDGGTGTSEAGMKWQMS